MAEQETEQAEMERDPFFMPWRVPRSDAAQRIVREAILAVEERERQEGSRQRKRRAKDQVTFEATVTAVISDALYRGLLDPSCRLAITRSNKTLGAASRYRPPAFNKTLPDILDALAALGLIEQRLGEQGTPFGRGAMTTIRAMPAMLRRARRQGVTPEDFGRQPGEEIIMLRGPRRGGKPGHDQEYRDTPFTRRARSELQLINGWLERADLSFDIAVMDEPRPVDTRERRLRRIFTRGSFESGGRLFGGFWQPIKSTERLHGLLIDGSPIAYLDFGQMTARIAYGMVGAPLPSDDLYKVPGLEPFRDGVKKLMNALLFADEPLQRKPQGTTKLLPAKPLSELRALIRRAHGPIARLFERGEGHRLQFMESEVLMAVLLALGHRDIVALPVHDAVIVRHDRATAAADHMTKVFRQSVGVEAKVSIEVSPVLLAQSPPSRARRARASERAQ